MTDQKVLEAVQMVLTKIGSSPETICRYTAEYAHLSMMAEKIPGFLEEGRRDKAMRWLGFMQGVLWKMGLASVEDLKAMNRSEDNG